MVSMSKNEELHFVTPIQAKLEIFRYQFDAKRRRIKLAHRECSPLVESPIIISDFDDPADLWVLGLR